MNNLEANDRSIPEYGEKDYGYVPFQDSDGERYLDIPLMSMEQRKSLFINTSSNNQVDFASSMLPTVPATAAPTDNNLWKNDESGAPGFVIQKQLLPIVSLTHEPYEVSFGPRVEGGFFLYDDIWTCYRRNYFRVLSTFNLTSIQDPSKSISQTDSIPLFVQFQGQSFQISCFKMTLSAFCESNFDKMVELVMHSAKLRGGNGMPSPKGVLPGGRDDDPTPPKTPLTPQSFSREKVTTMAAFDRVQFRSATANNGKRKAIQQYFRLMLELHAVCVDGSSFKVAETSSDNIVVRGRSPGHYADVERIRDKKKSNNSSRLLPYGMSTERRNSWTGNSQLLGMKHPSNTAPLSAAVLDNHLTDDAYSVVSGYEFPPHLANALYGNPQISSSAPISPVAASFAEQAEYLKKLQDPRTEPPTRTASPSVFHQLYTNPPSLEQTPSMENKELYYSREGKDANGKDLPNSLFGNTEFSVNGIAW